MGIGSYKDIYTLAQYKNRVTLISTELASSYGYHFLAEGRQELLKQIQILEAKEKRIFDLIGVKDLQDLNQRMKEYEEAVTNFSGVNLNEEIIAILTTENQEEYEAFEQAFFDFFNRVVLKSKPLQSFTSEAVQNLALNELNKQLKGKKGFKFSSTRGYNNNKIQVSSFTQEQKEAWRKAMENEFAQNGNKTSPAVAYYIQNFKSTGAKSKEKVEVKQDNNGFQIQHTLTWSEITERLTPTEAEKLKQSNPKKFNLINTKIENFIVSKVPKDQQMIRAIIKHILSKNPYAFFVGKNVNDITGILGEISGLYYLSKFFGGFNQKAISWSGGTHTGTDSKKPHRDIIIQDLGIQVKNSIKEDIGAISFSQAEIETMLNKTQMPQQTKDLFLNYFGTLSFNVPYYIENNKYIEGVPNNPNEKLRDFISTRSILENFEDQVEQLLSLSAAYFMYMDIYEKTSGIDANTLYLLGGKAFQTASAILSNIRDQLYQQERNFKIEANYKNERNIVTALNEKTRDENYSQIVLSNIELTSSYNFQLKIK